MYSGRPSESFKEVWKASISSQYFNVFSSSSEKEILSPNAANLDMVSLLDDYDMRRMSWKGWMSTRCKDLWDYLTFRVAQNLRFFSEFPTGFSTELSGSRPIFLFYLIFLLLAAFVAHYIITLDFIRCPGLSKEYQPSFFVVYQGLTCAISRQDAKFLEGYDVHWNRYYFSGLRQLAFLSNAIVVISHRASCI